MHDFGKVAVLMGGFSTERDVSLQSGEAIVAALRSKGVDAYPFDPKSQNIFDLKSLGFQTAFNTLHGTYGEDGTVQGVLESLGVAYTGCGVAASALGMDKYRTKLIWQAVGLPVPQCIVLDDNTDFATVEKTLGLPLFIKPAVEGSSVGVKKIKSLEDLKSGYESIKHLHGEILAEAFIDGGEYTCAILNGRVLPSIKIEPKNEFYDYEAKYNRDDTVYRCPSDLTESQEQEMADLALRAFAAIGGKGWGRVDFLKDKSGKLYLLEVNTLPGMTSHSLVPKAAAVAGIDFAQLCIEVLKTAHVG